jgi:hypothetical protein
MGKMRAEMGILEKTELSTSPYNGDAMWSETVISTINIAIKYIVTRDGAETLEHYVKLKRPWRVN